jgi:hypothetical protein
MNYKANRGNEPSGLTFLHPGDAQQEMIYG